MRGCGVALWRFRIRIRIRVIVIVLGFAARPRGSGSFAACWAGLVLGRVGVGGAEVMGACCGGDFVAIPGVPRGQQRRMVVEFRYLRARRPLGQPRSLPDFAARHDPLPAAHRPPLTRHRPPGHRSPATAHPPPLPTAHPSPSFGCHRPLAVATFGRHRPHCRLPAARRPPAPGVPALLLLFGGDLWGIGLVLDLDALVGRVAKGSGTGCGVIVRTT